MNTISGTVFYYGTEAERAAFTPLLPNVYFFATDTDLLWIWDGAWHQASGGGRKEFIIPLSGFGTGASKPNETILGNYLGYAFSINDLGYFTCEIRPDWDGISDWEIWIHWYINEAYATNTGEVRWAVIFTATKEDGTEVVDVGSTTINGADVNIPATAKRLVETGIFIPAANIQAHDSLGFQVKRIALVGGSNPAAEPVIVSIEIEYTANR